jgi:CDP-6-deoxy-D-xylo-4-hexulose-3-dehydrase
LGKDEQNLSAAELARQAVADRHSAPPFIPGESSIPVTGKVFGAEEIEAAIEASMDFWLTSGPYTEKFESRFAKVVGMRHAFSYPNIAEQSDSRLRRYRSWNICC